MSTPARRVLPVVGVALLVFGLPMAIHAPSIVRGEVPWFMDTVGQFYPMRWHAAALLHDGQLPLWNRTVFAGVPFLANPQWGILYPGHWPFFAWPGPRAWSLINALHIGLMGLGIGAWLALRGRRAGAAAGGLIAVAGAWPWAHLAFGAYLQAAAWAPWMFAAWEAAARGRRIAPWVLLGAVASAMQVLAGAPQLALYCQLGLIAYVAVGALTQPGRPAAMRRAILFLVGQGALAAGLAAPQWLPSLRFMADCERTGALAAAKVLGGTLNYSGLVHAWFGGGARPEDAEQILYPGITALVLALVGLGVARRVPHRADADKGGSVLPLVVLIALACLWSLRSVARMMYPWCPLISHFHDPRRMLFLGYLAVAVLAGEGADYLWRSAPARDRHPATARFALIFAVFLALGECILFVHARIDMKSVRPDAFQLADPQKVTGIGPGERFFAQDIGIQYTYNYTRGDFASTLLPNLGALYGMEDIQGYDPFIPWRYAVAMRRLNSHPQQSPTLYPSHFGLVRSAQSRYLRQFGPFKVRGLVNMRWPFFIPRWLGPGESFEAPLTPPVRIANPGFTARLYAAVQIRPGGMFASRIQADYHHKNVKLRPRSTFNIMPSAVGDVDAVALNPDIWPPAPSDITPVHASASAHAIASPFDGLADKVVLTNRGPQPAFIYGFGVREGNTPYDPVAPYDTYGTWEPDWTEAFVPVVEIHRIAPPSPAERPTYEKWAQRYLPTATRIELPAGSPAPDVPVRVLSGWKYLRRRANRLDIALPPGHTGGWLVLSEPWARGWKCTVDGRTAPIYPAEVMFRAVPVAPGAATVVMQYTPPGLTDGLLLCAAALLAFAAVALRPARQRRAA